MKLRFWLFLLFLAVWALPAHAQDPVKWTATFVPADTRAGEVGQIQLDATIDDGWHIYAPTTPAGGPIPTKIEVTANPQFKAVGKIDQSKPLSKHDEGFDMQVELYEGSASFKVPLQLAKTAKGTLKGVVSVFYQSCNDKTCLPPKTVEVPFTIAVAAGATRPDHAKVAAPAPAPKSNPPGGAASPGGGKPAGTTPGITKTDAPITVSKAGNGLLSLIGAAFIGGFLALFTPCVFPMIPITVSLFTKTNGETKPTLAGPIAYCAGIISTFTAVGVIVSLVFGASGITRFAASPWVNLALFTLFVVLALNLFGVYEILVPASVLNRVQPRGKGGLVAPFLMGLAFTLTSFTCTVPFVGTTLVSTATQGALYPAIGMFCFASAFALPFFLLALFPTFLTRLPRSGEWLVSVKAFMGFLELAAALKFLQTADYTLQLGLLTRPIFLAIWFAIALIAGAYLMRWLRLPNDSPNIKVGPLRRVLGVATLGTAAWLLAANNGVSLRQLEAFPPPPEYGQKTASNDGWLKNDLNAALAQAKAENKPLLINFTGYACTNCRLMERNVLPKPEVVQELNGMVPVELFTDAQTPISRSFQAYQQQKFGSITLPLYAVISPDGQVAGRLDGLEDDPQKFADFLKAAKDKVRQAKADTPTQNPSI